MSRSTLTPLAWAVAVVLLLGSVFAIASCDPTSSAPSTSVEIDVDHHTRPHTKAPSYRKPSTPRLTKRR